MTRSTKPKKRVLSVRHALERLVMSLNDYPIMEEAVRTALADARKTLDEIDQKFLDSRLGIKE